MPVCYITLSENINLPSNKECIEIRKVIAENLKTRKKFLDEHHIVLRFQTSEKVNMLGYIELDIFAQFYFSRFRNRDRRARNISSGVSSILNIDCATWINLGFVGYSRVTTKGNEFYSD